MLQRAYGDLGPDTVPCTLNKHCTVHRVNSKLYKLHCTLYTLHSTLYTLHSRLYTLDYTLHYTLYTMHYTLHTIHYTLRLLCSVEFAMLSPAKQAVAVPGIKVLWYYGHNTRSVHSGELQTCRRGFGKPTV